jgi:hypothetical protein
MILLPLMAATLATAPIAPADKADLRCIALFSIMASEMPEEQAGMTGAIMFYIGRIEGRGSGLDLEAGLGLAVDEFEGDADRIKTEAQRCGNEMTVKGEEVQKVGDSLARSGKN